MRRFSFTEVKVTDDAVYISDDCIPGTVSVTDMAEDVVRIMKETRPGKRIIYRDATGEWCEILHSDGEFNGLARHDGLGH